jgi:CysZ protein
MSSALAPRGADTLARPLSRPGFLAGTGALFSGFRFLAVTPATWPLAMVPVAVVIAVTAALGGGAIHLVTPWVAGIFGPRWAFLAVVVDVLAGMLALILAGLVGFALAQPLSGPALNRIVRRAEADLGAPAWPPSGAVEDVGRALGSLAVGYALGLPVLAALALVTFLVPPAAVVTVPLKLMVLALLFAWDLCDYPLSIHGVPVAARVAFVARNAGAMIGFGFGLALLSLIPCMLFFALPAGVAGAARLTRRIELFEASRRP